MEVKKVLKIMLTLPVGMFFCFGVLCKVVGDYLLSNKWYVLQFEKFSNWVNN